MYGQAIREANLNSNLVGFRDRSQVLQIARVGELVDHAHGILCVIDDVSDYCWPDESGSTGYDDTVHDCPEMLLSGKRSV